MPPASFAFGLLNTARGLRAFRGRGVYDRRVSFFFLGWIGDVGFFFLTRRQQRGHHRQKDIFLHAQTIAFPVRRSRIRLRSLAMAQQSFLPRGIIRHPAAYWIDAASDY